MLTFLALYLFVCVTTTSTEGGYEEQLSTIPDLNIAAMEGIEQDFFVTSAGQNGTPIDAEIQDMLTDQMKFAAIAYYGQNIITKWNCTYCQSSSLEANFVKYISNEVTDIHSYIVTDHRKKEIHIVFRGTQSIRNWIMNLNAFLVHLKGQPRWSFAKLNTTKVSSDIMVHSGFLINYMSIRDRLMKTIRKLKQKHQDHHIFINGHSLGGALALLCGIDIHQQMQFQNVSIVTVGGPRVGNLEFDQYMKQTGYRIFRVINHGDVVPHLPLKVMGYADIDFEAFIDSNGSVFQCNKNVSCSGQELFHLNAKDHSQALGIHFGSRRNQ